MRVTEQLLFGSFMRDINKNRGEMAKIQSALSSGKSVRLPSDSPVEFQRSRVIEENIRKEQQYQNNISTGLRQSRMAQEALEETVDRLIEIKGKLIQASTGTSNSQVRETMARDIEGIRNSLINTLNVSSGDRYLFAGTNSQTRPFELDDTQNGGVADNSVVNNPKVMVGDGVSLDISISGAELRNTAAGDLFENIGGIITALNTNNESELNQHLTYTEQSIEHVTKKVARIATNINRMEFLFEQYESAQISQRAEISNLVDTDFAQSFSDLQRNQIAYESALAVHASLFSNSLLDFL